MIRLLTARVRTGVVVSAMVATVPMITFAQTTEPAIESAPAAAKEVEANANPTGDENDTSVQRPAVPALVEVELQRRFNELRSEILDDRASYIDRWLSVITIVLTFFGIVAVIAGYIGFRRFQAIEADAKNSVKTVTDLAEAAKRHVEEIERNRDQSDEIVRDMNAEAAADDPEEAQQAVENLQNNPAASPIGKAIAHAISLQQQGKRDEAIAKWRAVALIAEESDNDLAARAWYSVGYLIRDGSPEDCIVANDRAIRLKPDLAVAYNDRGNAKAVLGRRDEAIADYDEAIRLKPDYAMPYNNRGIEKVALGRRDEAIADYDEAIRLKPDFAIAYNNRGVEKAVLGRRDEAIADYDEAIRLEPDDAEAYHNRGTEKAVLGRRDEAIADYDEAIRRKPDHAGAYNNRGIAKAALGLKDEARRDFETALDLARKAGNTGVIAAAEQALRDLDDVGGL